MAGPSLSGQFWPCAQHTDTGDVIIPFCDFFNPFKSPIFRMLSNLQQLFKIWDQKPLFIAFNSKILS